MCEHRKPMSLVTPEAHDCACSNRERPAVGRVVPPTAELQFPEVRFPTPRMLAMAGDAGLRALVRRHHELLRHSEIAELFATPDDEFSRLVELIADYIVETCGGPANYSQSRGTACMRTRHFPFSIDERGREVWLKKLYQAMADTGLPVELREEYWTWMESFSIRMINRRTTKDQPLRISWLEAGERFTVAAA